VGCGGGSEDVCDDRGVALVRRKGEKCFYHTLKLVNHSGGTDFPQCCVEGHCVCVSNVFCS
jgi:hypothetical protein